MANNAKAVCNGETDGLVKIAADKSSHKIIGGMAVCAAASVQTESQ